MTPFRSISVFYHVAALNSVSAAAEQLNVTASAVSQQVRVLEEQLGMTLVAKVGRKVKLTEDGERYFDLISQHVEEIIRSTEIVRGNRTTTLLTIRATPTVSTKWILPRLPRHKRGSAGRSTGFPFALCSMCCRRGDRRHSPARKIAHRGLRKGS